MLYDSWMSTAKRRRRTGSIVPRALLGTVIAGVIPACARQQSASTASTAPVDASVALRTDALPIDAGVLHEAGVDATHVMPTSIDAITGDATTAAAVADAHVTETVVDAGAHRHPHPVPRARPPIDRFRMYGVAHRAFEPGDHGHGAE